jgi:flagellar basal-body rod protein FlgF
LASGIWTAASGAAAQALAVDTIANNLANADTLGFKKDITTFKEYLATLERDHPVTDIPRGPVKDKDFYPLDGRDQSFVVTNGTYTNFQQGGLRVTHGPLDLALDGPGFFEVSTPNGPRFTRQGTLKIAQDGRLVTSEGHPVLASQPAGLAATQGGVATQNDAARFISLRDRPGTITINSVGELRVGDDLVAKLSVVEFQDNNKLRKSGGQLFENMDPQNFSTFPQRSVVHQGVLEISNVNPVEEMTQMLKAQRLFEQDMKALRTYGELLGKEANDIGKL